MTSVTTSIVITTTSQRKAPVSKRELDQIWTESDPIWSGGGWYTVTVVHDRVAEDSLFPPFGQLLLLLQG